MSAESLEPLGECGFNEPHEPHGYVIADNGRPLGLECPGLPEGYPVGIALDDLARLARDVVSRDAAVRRRGDLRHLEDEQTLAYAQAILRRLRLAGWRV